MRQNVSIVLAALALMLGCQTVESDLNIRETRKIRLETSSAGFQQASNKRNSQPSDPFILHSAILFAETLKVDVSYSGGCKTHLFEAFYKRDASSGTVEILIHHNSQNDNCEAYLTETLEIDLSGKIEEGDQVVVLNGSSQESLTADFSPCRLAQGDSCEIVVKAERAICGVGVWEDLWLKPQNGIWYQPSVIASGIRRPVEGKTYKVIIGSAPSFQYDGALCLAYPGPSIPVRIISMQALD